MPTEISPPTAFTASNTTVIFTIVGGVVVTDVTVLVVITTTMNNLSELAMKHSCVEALLGPSVTCISNMRVARDGGIDEVDSATIAVTGRISAHLGHHLGQAQSPSRR